MVSWYKIMSRLPGENLKKLFYFFKLLPFVNLGVGNFNIDIFTSKHLIASSFKLCQLITG